MRWPILGVVILAALVLGSCRDEERPLRYEKGVYGGPSEAPLPKEQMDDLRRRAARQGVL
jgi:hypothetical protein